jgi:hypothetical protein
MVGGEKPMPRHVFRVCVAAALLAGIVRTSGAAEWNDGQGLFAPRPLELPSGTKLPITPTELSLRLTAAGFRVVGAEEGPVAIRELVAPGLETTGQTGEPDVSRRIVDLALPWDADLSTLALSCPTPEERCVGRFVVRPVASEAFFHPKNGVVVTCPPRESVVLDAQGRDKALYANSTPVPASVVSVVGAGQYRKYVYVRLQFNPYRWNPLTHELVAVESLDVKISWKKKLTDEARMLELLSDPVVLSPVVLAGRFVNFSELLAWYEIGNRSGTWDYVVVLPRATKTGSTALTSFVAHKESLGFKVALVSVEAIDAAYSSAGGERADRIRAFLQDKYAEWGVRYVLLVGDPNPYDRTCTTDAVGSVPMKMAWPRGDGAETPTPTDHYFADLSGNWDVDGDGFAACYSDDYTVEQEARSMGGVPYTFVWLRYGFDFDSELLVGRIPFDTIEKVDAVLSRTINYENATSAEVARRRRVFLAMTHLNGVTDRAYLGRQIHSELVGPNGLTGVTLYDPWSSLSATYQLENEKLISVWKEKGAGMVIWAGHGTNFSAIICDGSRLMDWRTVPDLEKHPAPFVFQESCSNANPDFNEKLAHTLLEQVAIGTVASSTEGYFRFGQEDFGAGSSSGDCSYRVARGYVSAWPSGEALAFMRSGCSPEGSSEVQTLMAFNLYGDPSVIFQH